MGGQSRAWIQRQHRDELCKESVISAIHFSSEMKSLLTASILNLLHADCDSELFLLLDILPRSLLVSHVSRLLSHLSFYLPNRIRLHKFKWSLDQGRRWKRLVGPLLPNRFHRNRSVEIPSRAQSQWFSFL